jgi:hypothetical protein
MRSQIFCPGPSLADWLASGVAVADPEAHRIAVNRAVLAPGLHCQWHCAGDPAAIAAGPTPAGTRLFTKRSTIAAMPAAAAAGAVEWESLFDLIAPTTVCEWNRYSLLAAIVLATWLTATSIDVYGCDWTEGGADFDAPPGSTVAADANRGPERWADERRGYEKLTAWLAPRGITVRRVFRESEI